MAMSNFNQELTLKQLESAVDGDPKLRLPHLYNLLSILKCAVPAGAWVGLYLFDKETGLLLLGPFQGTPACEKIAPGKGVVGTCFSKNETIVVDDVSKFPGYICCDAAAASEICVPLQKEGAAIGALDIDYPAGFNFEGESDFYEAAAKLIAPLIS